MGINVSMKGREEIKFTVKDVTPVRQQKVAIITNVTLRRRSPGESVSKTLILSRRFQKLNKYCLIFKLSNYGMGQVVIGINPI
jgi:hypothetical protein